MIKGYQETLDFLFTQLPMYQRQGAAAYKKDLSNTIALCNALGNPERSFKSIHIAGTNGKGTTTHTVASILQESGYKTGLHTSPHLKDFRERIKINGEMVSQNFVVDFVEKHKDIIRDLSPSFFEITVVMAFEYFRQQNVDIVVLETGMGGRLDSTNVVDPLICAITAIGMDHTKFLGNTLVAIAGEKAGIIKPNRPVVLYNFENDKVKEVFVNKAEELGSSVNANAELYKFKAEDYGRISFSSPSLKLENFRPGVIGNYYLNNLPVACEVVLELRKLGYSLEDENIKSGIEKVVENTSLKGRWQLLSNKPYVFADVGHNADGIKAILNQLANMEFEKLHIVWGSVNDKDMNEIFDLLPSDAFYYFCEANIPRSLPLRELQDIGVGRALSFKSIKNVNLALSEAKKQATENDVIWIGGSTFVVAEIDEL